MKKKEIFVTNSARQTKKLGEMLAKELRGGPASPDKRASRGGEIICLTGELGSGKTTFAQGILKGLGVKGPYTSPTFVVMKHYKASPRVRPFPPAPREERGSSKPSFILNIYHIDAYRVGSKDILDLGWKEIIAGKKNIIIAEWAERIKSIIPKNAVWVKFKYKGKDKREIILNSKFKNQNAK